MATRKHRKSGKSRKSTKRFRRTRSKRQRGGGELEDNLYKAINEHNLDNVIEVLDAGVDINARIDNYDGGTALSMASYSGHTDIVAKLLERGANVNAIDNNGSTALFQASVSFDLERGEPEVVAMLLDAGADVNVKKPDGRTALQMASWYGHMEVVEILLEQPGIDVNAQDNRGNTALQHAINKGHIEIVELLSGEKQTPPCMSQEVFDTCTKDGDGIPQCGIMMTELTKENAVRTHPPQPHKEGEKPNTTDCFDRENLRRWLRTTKENPITKLPVEQSWINTNMGKQDCEPQTETVFNIPPTGGKRKTRKSKKSKKSKKTRSSRKRGGAPGDKKKEQSYKVLKQLIDDNKISQTNQQDLNQMFFNYSKHGTLSAVIELLLAKAIDVNMIDDDGNTPLIVASDYGHTKIVKLLLNNGADPNIENKKGWTAVDFAVGFLMEKGLDYKHIVETDLFIALTNAGGLPGTAFHDMYKSPSSQTRSDTGAKIHIPTAPGIDDV